jgi:hypothetical protein
VDTGTAEGRGHVADLGDLVSHHAGRLPGVSIADIETAPWERWVSFDDPDGNGIILQETIPL